MANYGSRWGIKGSSEVSDGLAAVYQFEDSINVTNANAKHPAGRVSYVGLSGGFGTITLGHTWKAGYNHFGGIVDQSFWNGDPETGARHSNAISYSTAVGSLSFQVDVNADRGTDKSTDSAQFGATLQVGENGKIAVAHIAHPTKDMDLPDYKTASMADGDGVVSAAIAANPTAHIDDHKSSFIGGEYKIGDIAFHLGYAQHKEDTDAKAAMWKKAVERNVATNVVGSDAGYGAGLKGGDLLNRKGKTGFFGLSGGIGDTGVSYALMVRNKKITTTSVTASQQDLYTAYDKAYMDFSMANTDPNAAAKNGDPIPKEPDAVRKPGIDPDEFTGTNTEKRTANDGTVDPDQETTDRMRGSMKSTAKTSPWMVRLSRSLGGGASVHFEYVNDDNDATKNTSLLALKVDF